MKAKRALTLLLALCLLVSVLSPAAYAVTPGTNVNQAKPEEESTFRGASTLKGSKADETDAEPTGHWTAEQTYADVDLLNAQLRADLAELRQAAEIYKEDDMVVAFIVLEDAPLAEKAYASIAEAPEAEVNALLAKQNSLIASVEKTIGQKLEIRHQFTYLTNSVTVRLPFGKLAQVADVKGVKSVFLAPQYNPCTAAAAEMTGASNVWWDLGYTGVGMKVAIIDTGLDLDHPSFAVAPQTNRNSMTEADIEAVLPQLNAYKVMPTVTADKLYRSEKIPYAFNYVDESLVADHSRDDQGYHGTHVAGIVAANPMWTTEVVGMAPDAQVVVMKVFGAAGGAYTDDIIAALEDAMTLGCDVANLSLGSPAGFATANEEVDNVYARIKDHDLIVAIASGNEGTSSSQNMLGTDKNLTSDPDNATVSSPATYQNATVVASAENAMIVSDYFVVGFDAIAYSDGTGLNVTFADLGTAQEFEYVMVPGLGELADYAGLDVEGKIAVVSRGAIAFSQKLANAEAMGAAALIVYNNEAGTIGMQMTDNDGNLPEGVSGFVPAVSVSQKAGAKMAAAEEKILMISPYEGSVPSDDAGQMSAFSSWGVAPELRLLPDLTGIGGNVYSTIDGGEYEVMSGTSMATPQVAGCTALILEYLRAEHPELEGSELRTVAEHLLMSAATPIVDAVSQVEASPRQQGSGLVNPEAAIEAESYLSVEGSTQPKASLGDDCAKTGKYSFTFRVHNMGTAPKTFTFDSSLLTEDYVTMYGMDFMAEHDVALTGTVSFSEESVTVAPGESAAVTVEITLSDADKAMLDAHYENGMYVEGFVYAAGEDGEALSLPFLGFYGDWTQAPLMDEGFWYSEDFWDSEAELTAKEYYNIIWTDLQGTNWVLGGNPYSGEMGTDPENNYVVSPNGDGLVDGFDEIYFAHMRNAETMTVTFADAESGKVYFQDTLEKLNKTMYQSSYGQVVPSLYSWYGQLWDFTDENGKVLPDGTRMVMSVEGKLSFDAHEQNNLNNSWSVPVMVDTKAPMLTEVEEFTDGTRQCIALTFEDTSSVALAAIYDATFTHVLARFYDYDLEQNPDGTYTLPLDITGLGNEFGVVLSDYGVNEGMYTVRYELDDNLPEKPASGLYAYRVADSAYEYGDESFYGWVSIDPETAEVTQLTNDMYEYYALTAAEYAAGYVFGVDAGNNFVVMRPGMWTRQVIRPLDVAVEDLAFDASTETMYALTRDGDYNASLTTIDLLTGEMDTVCELGYYYSGPIAIAAAEGKVYSAVYGQNGLYEIDTESGAPVQVLAYDPAIAPSYAQTMTYSAEKNCLYWLAYSFSWTTGTTSALYTVDLEDMSYTVQDFDHDMEFIGAVTLEDPQYPAFECDGAEDCPSKVFTDVNPDAWYHEGVDFVVANNLMNGVSANLFAPNKIIDRVQTVTVLYRLAGSPQVEGELEFTDVPANHWGRDAVIWASRVGITNGTGNGKFSPTTQLSREQAVTFLYRYAALAGYDVTSKYDSLVAFRDCYQVSGFAVPAMRWAVAENLINGVTADTLAPKAVCTRAQFATMLMRLEKNVMFGSHLAIGPVTQILLEESVKLGLGSQYALTYYTLPWNSQAQVEWTSSDETVATVENGVVTAMGVGEAVITASADEASAQCLVSVLDVQGTVYAYNYYNGATTFGDLIRFELGDLPGFDSIADAPIDFVAGDFNGNDGCFYGYSETYQLYRWNLETGSCVAVGDAVTGMQIFDMAYDYSTGNMYASVYMSAYDAGGIMQVNMRNGAMYPLGFDYNYTVYMPLACSTEGQLYSITAGGVLCSLTINEDWGEIEATEIADLGFGSLQYLQSMCWDHDHDQLVWAAALGSSAIVWIDPEDGSTLILGSPTGDTGFEYMGLFTIPSEIPELGYIPVEDMYPIDESMTVMEGGTKMPNVEINPWNATNQEIVWTSDDETIAYVNEDGMVVGVSEGETVIRGVLDDNGEIFQCEIAVKVAASAGSVYGFLLMDMANFGGNAWLEFNPADPSSPEQIGAAYYSFYSAEYVDGKIYGYCYDSEDWESPMYFATLDAETFNILDMKAIDNCPTVYDLTYDYTRGTMFAAAGYGDTSSDLYVVDLSSGEPIKVMDFDPFILGLAASEDGTLYAVSSSEEILDEWGFPIDFGGSVLYAINADTMTMEPVGDTGVKCNMMTSMTYDYASGSLYWAPLFRQDFFSPSVSSFAMTDPATAETVNLGTPGKAGMQIGALYTKPSHVPETRQELSTIFLTQTLVEASVGDTVTLNAITIPGNLDGIELTWFSMDESVATVEDGVVTAVGGGAATIGVIAEYGYDACYATCQVVVYTENDRFVAYSSTMGGWAGISRSDVSDVVLLGETGVNVTAAADVNGTIYAYGADGTLYTVGEDYSMTEIGSSGVTASEGVFCVRDMAYDAGTDTLYALGATTLETEYGTMEGSNILYTVDMTTGALEEVVQMQDVQLHGLAVTADGTVFTYRTFDDAILIVDTANGALFQVATLQSLQIYADELAAQSICYDAATNQLYLMITTNNRFYKMFTMNVSSYALTEIATIGQTTYDPDTWTTSGDLFAALVIPEL